MATDKKNYTLIEGIGSSENMFAVTKRGVVIKEFWLDSMTIEESVQFVRLAQAEKKNEASEKQAYSFYAMVLSDRAVDGERIAADWIKKHLSRVGLIRIMISLSDGALQMPEDALEGDDNANPS